MSHGYLGATKVWGLDEFDVLTNDELIQLVIEHERKCQDKGACHATKGLPPDVLQAVIQELKKDLTQVKNKWMREEIESILTQTSGV